MRTTVVVVLALLQLAASSPYAGYAHGYDPQYTYSYSSGVSSGQESRAGSLTQGGFAYVDANGQVQSRSYVADGARGFVVTASDAQEPVRDTPEVARARQEHLEAVARAKALVSGARGDAVAQLLLPPQPVAETAEVAAARARHLAVVQDAQARAGLVSPHVYGPTPSPPWSSTPAPVQDTVEVAAAKAKHLAAVEEAKIKLASARSGLGVTSHQQAYSSASSSSSSSNGQQRLHQAVYSVTAAPPSPVQDTVEVAAAKAQHLASVAQAAARVSSSSVASEYGVPSARFHYPNVPGDLVAGRYPAPAPSPIAVAAPAPAWPATVAVRYNTIADLEDASGRYVADDEGRYVPGREDAEGQYDTRLDAEGQYDPRLNDEGQYVPSLNDEGQWVPSANEGQYVAGQQEDNMPYSYSYSDGLSSKTETKTVDGITRGRFSYVDANGVLQAVDYESDNVNGFRAAGTNLPQPPAPVAAAVSSARVYHPPGPSSYAAPPPSVAAYRAAPVAAYAVAAPLPRPIAAAYATQGPEGPQGPTDTAEVAAAKAAHFAAHREAGARLANAYAGRR